MGKSKSEVREELEAKKIKSKKVFMIYSPH